MVQGRCSLGSVNFKGKSPESLERLRQAQKAMPKAIAGIVAPGKEKVARIPWPLRKKQECSFNLFIL
jgi:hypothetical protein